MVAVAVASNTALTPLRTSSSVDLVEHPVPTSPTSTDGWGELENGLDEQDDDKEGWDDIEPLEEPKPSPALANIQAAQKMPVSQPKAALAQPKPAGSFISFLAQLILVYSVATYGLASWFSEYCVFAHVC